MSWPNGGAGTMRAMPTALAANKLSVSGPKIEVQLHGKPRKADSMAPKGGGSRGNASKLGEAGGAGRSTAMGESDTPPSAKKPTSNFAFPSRLNGHGSVSNPSGAEKSDLTYWTVSFGSAVRFGHLCRECNHYIAKGDSIAVRDGRKIRLFYHANCYSGTSDPRTQTHSSYRQLKESHHASAYKFNVISGQAPPIKGAGPWTVSSYGIKTTTAST
eukprot:GHVT01080223.1.p1 GENE.GHVT01080223.1~~GHVT01080223.1.p1  ORF type:complete len:215 (-),score=12.36 GHVT01080223.1:89-733(-)